MAAWRSVSVVLLTLGSALQDWSWSWGVGPTGMLKPLASSRAASSVSCGQSEEVQLLVPGTPPMHSISAVRSLSSQPIFLIYCLWLLMSHLKGPEAGVGHGGRGTSARTGALE